MQILFLSFMFLSSCMTNKRQLELHKNSLIGYCLEEIELKLKQNHCHSVNYRKSPTEYIFRCQKPDRYRNNFWDTWWFRLTSSGKKLPPEKEEQIRQHTICIDGRFRLEAYPPSK